MAGFGTIGESQGTPLTGSGNSDLSLDSIVNDLRSNSYVGFPNSTDFSGSFLDRFFGNDEKDESNYLENNDFMEYLEGLLSSVGQESVENRLFNSQEAEKARKFSASEAEKNRAWLADMSSSSYQRAVADLQKAGLNPILAYQQGGASTPNSSTPGSSSASHQTPGGDTLSSILNAFANLISSAAGIGKMISSFQPNVNYNYSNSTSKSTNYNHNFKYN